MMMMKNAVKQLEYSEESNRKDQAEDVQSGQ